MRFSGLHSPQISLFFFLKGKYHINESLDFTRKKDLKFVIPWQKKLKNKVAIRIKKLDENPSSARIHSAIRLRNCFLSLLAVMMFRISLLMNLKTVSGGRTRLLCRTLFLCFQRWYKIDWAVNFFKREGASDELPLIQERSSDQFVNIAAGGLRWEMQRRQTLVL